MGKRKAEAEEWELFKDEILQLYAKHTLSEVMSIMAGKGFRRTKSQYEGRLKKWRETASQQSVSNIRTNITAQEWKYIVERIDQRQKAGKSSSVTVRGFEVPQSRIKKQGRVHSYKTTLEKLAPKICPTESPDIVVSTPPERSLTPAMKQRYLDFSLYFERLPWRIFTDHLNATMRLVSGVDSRSGSSLGSFNTSNQVSMDLIVSEAELDAIEARSEGYLPTPDVIASEAGSDPCSSLATRGTQLDLLKYLVGMVSNCHDDYKMRKKLRKLAQYESNLKFLSRLVTMKEVAAKAFVEKLFNILLNEGDFEPNIPLVKVLLDSGVNLNGTDSDGLSRLDQVLYSLQQSGSEDYAIIALELLIRGATRCTPQKYLFLHFKILPSPLDLLILHVDEHILQRFIESDLAIQWKDRNITLGTFFITVYRGYIEIFQKLSTLRPMIFTELRESPWILFEAAAYGGRLSMIKYLQKVRFDITLTDSHERGNPLVFAIGSSPEKREIFQYLLDHGSSIHHYGNGAMLQFLEQPVGLYDRIDVIFDKNIKNITPIHAATMFGQETQIRTLLKLGADPNQHGLAFPIQLSARLENNEVARILLKEGADPNSTTQPDSRRGGHTPKNIPELRYQTALLIAVQYSNFKTAQVLQNAGADFPVPPLCTCGYNENRLGGDDWNTGFPTITVIGEYETSQEITHIHTHHDTNNNTCVYNKDRLWNPLLLTDSEDAFSYLLGRKPVWLKDHWVSRRCFSRTVRKFPWRFVSHHIKIGTFPTLCIDKEALLLKAIQYRDDQWSCYLAGLSYQSKLRGFVIAASLRQTNTVQKFLEQGVWPDDSVMMEYEFHRKEGLCSPLDPMLSTKDNELQSMMLQHYTKVVFNTNPTSSVHLERAYSIAIRHGCISLAELVKPNRGVDNAKFTGNCYDLDKYATGPSPSLEIYSAVQIASAFCQVDTAIWLLAQGANPNISYDALTDPLGYHSPLQCAAKHGKTALVIALLRKGARVNDPPINARGATALQFAAISGHFEMLKVLLEAGADINAPPSKWEGRTAIEGAAEQGRLDMVSFLMEAGANIQGTENANYRRTVYRAWAHGHYVLAEMVQQWKSERYGPNDCEPIESIVRSMDMTTLGCAARDRLELPDSSMGYYDPCPVCKDECTRDEDSESCEDEYDWDGNSE